MRKYINEEEILIQLNKYEIENKEKVLADIDESINKIINQAKRDKNKILKAEEIFNNGISFQEIYPKYDCSKLPTWIKDELPNVKVIGNSKKTLVTRDGRRFQLDNTLNDLSGAEWTYFINSVINTSYKTSGEDSYAHHIRKIHPTPKPPSLMKDIISFFTKEKEIVLDYFMGVGGSLLGASACNRRALGIELNQRYIEAYRQATNYLNLPECPTICGDSMKIMKSSCLDKYFNKEKASLILIDPPYGNMMSREKTGADIKKYGTNATPFTDIEEDLGNIKNLDIFFEKLKEIINYSLKYLKNKGYVVVFIKDLQPTGKETNLLHSKLINTLNEIDILEYKGLKIWADQTSKLFPYGYPFSFVSNQIHQYIVIFRKKH